MKYKNMGLIDKFFNKRENNKHAIDGKIPEGTAYAVWSCLCDENSCAVCRSHEGLNFLPDLASVHFSPHSSCNAPTGCRCGIVYVMREESGALDTADFIRRNGGKATAGELSKYEEEKLAPIREKEKKANMASNKIHEAMQFEKDKPEESVCLYREAITLKKEIAVQFPDNWCWRDFPYMYNRLTLILERLGRYEEVIAEIGSYKKLPCDDKGSKTDRQSIEKRKIRIEKSQI